MVKPSKDWLVRVKFDNNDHVDVDYVAESEELDRKIEEALGILLPPRKEKDGSKEASED